MAACGYATCNLPVRFLIVLLLQYTSNLHDINPLIECVRNPIPFLGKTSGSPIENTLLEQTLRRLVQGELFWHLRLSLTAHNDQSIAFVPVFFRAFVYILPNQEEINCKINSEGVNVSLGKENKKHVVRIVC